MVLFPLLLLLRKIIRIYDILTKNELLGAPGFPSTTYHGQIEELLGAVKIYISLEEARQLDRVGGFHRVHVLVHCGRDRAG